MNVPNQIPTQTQTAMARYGAVKVTTSSPGQLLVMLYDGLLRFLREAQIAMTAKDRKRTGERISRSHAILAQLLSTLDPTHNPQLCAHLQPLYIFCMQHLLKANVEQDPAKLDELIRVLTPLRDAWSTAVAQLAAGTT